MRKNNDYFYNSLSSDKLYKVAKHKAKKHRSHNGDHDSSKPNSFEKDILNELNIVTIVEKNDFDFNYD